MPKTPTIKSRRVAILVADGFDVATVTAMKTALTAGGAFPFVIGPRRGSGQRSTLFDALYLPNGDGEYGAALRANGRVLHWIAEAFGHCKAIAGLGQGLNTIQHALAHCVPELVFGRFDSDEVVTSYGVITSGKYSLASGAADVLDIVSGDDKGFVSNFAFVISQHRCFEREMAGLTSKVAY
ncbi:hypothetical protein DFH06DRAFT_1330174 [Mycena polygramma]|nr:hypothetical protein DFH06DRAFT_1330174 [Mycena polygramma]